MSGRSKNRVTEENINRRIFVGKQKHPIAIIKRGEIKDYLDDDFYDYYECWKIFNSGGGYPYGDGWAYYPPLFVNILSAFQGEWRSLTNANI